ncbi:Putative cysteine protease YraA (plasmid) [Streptomyces sp. YIM 121038]|uniref:DJ-1/PfpI family protein n=1 Tax=Streptomyces sp. YIM 121038 TaxID=2136401 RepID=UPI00111008BF|nr:DJ-1/PfpI family protein [Streptomyces sp. YIM 121038]QCX82661.1 Putative cysteine protease YraA [Streptomyces sp. YIM 121038]
MPASKILIVAGDATEDLELFYGMQRLTEEGYQVTIAAPKAKKLKLVSHDFDGTYEDTYTEFPGKSWPADIAFADVNPEDYAGLFVPGGRAPEHLRHNADFRRVVMAFFTANKPVAHTCHAAIALAPLGVLKGRTTTTFPQVAPEVELGGGTFVDAAPVVDGNLVGARDWSENPQLFREFLKLLRQSAPLTD